MDGKTVKDLISQLPELITKQYRAAEFHPEEEGSSKLNNHIFLISNDLRNINQSLMNTGNNINYLMLNTINRLDIIKRGIDYEKQRLQDITMLCNNYTDFDNVVVLGASDFTGDFNYSNNSFSVERSDNEKVKIAIRDISGNGYEGNDFVIKNNEYIKNSLDTSQRKHLRDNSLTNYYEYSRVTASNTEEYLNDFFNTDSEEAKCTISMEAEFPVNEITIDSTNDNTMVIGAQYSKDGIEYHHIQFSPFILNNKDKSYDSPDYINGSNIISIPNARFFKVTLQSNGFNDDLCAFTRKITEEGKNTVTSEVRVVKSARRHVIQINEITAYRNTYQTSSVMKSKSFSQDNVLSVAVFANQYIPSSLSSDSIKYILTVNGIDYDIVPINSHSNGYKVIRFSQGKTSAQYTKYIGESIKSVTLTIIMKQKGNVTPYINNLKLLVGGDD